MKKTIYLIACDEERYLGEGMTDQSVKILREHGGFENEVKARECARHLNLSNRNGPFKYVVEMDLHN